MHPETRRAIKRAILLRILPTFAILSIALVLVKPDWRVLLVGISLAIPVGLILAVVIRRRVREAGIAVAAEGGSPVKVALEVRPGVLAIGLAASVALGAALGAAEERFGFDLRDSGVVVGVPLLLLAVGLSLRPKRPDSRGGRPAAFYVGSAVNPRGRRG